MPDFGERVLKASRKCAWGVVGLASRPDVSNVYRAPVKSPRTDEIETVRAVIGPATLEPEWGYVVTGRGQLIQDSVRTNWAEKKAPWRLALPPITPWFRSRLRRADTADRAVVSLRHWYEWNYFHFHFDVLGKLPLLADAGIPTETPLVVGPYVNDVGFARELMSLGRLRDRCWLIQDHHQYTSASRIYFCQTRRSFKARIDPVLDDMEIPHTTPAADRNVFLTRPNTATRRIINVDAVGNFLKDLRFELVDTSTMPISDQIAVFQSARNIVGVHGAGLTNIVYRRGQELSLLELYGDYNSMDFRTICHEFGYSWSGLPGPSEGGFHMHANFRVNLVDLGDAVMSMLRPKTVS